MMNHRNNFKTYDKYSPVLTEKDEKLKKSARKALSNSSRSKSNKNLSQRDQQKSSEGIASPRGRALSQNGSVEKGIRSKSVGERKNKSVRKVSPSPVSNLSKNAQKKPEPKNLVINDRPHEPHPLIEDLTTPQGEVKVTMARSPEILRNHPDLESFMSVQIESVDPLPPFDLEETELTTIDLESIAIVYDKIRQIFKLIVIHRELKASEKTTILSPDDLVKMAVKLAQD